MEVRFENITVTARVLVGQRGQDTVLNYYGKCIAVRLPQGSKHRNHDCAGQHTGMMAGCTMEAATGVMMSHVLIRLIPMLGAGVSTCMDTC